MFFKKFFRYFKLKISNRNKYIQDKSISISYIDIDYNIYESKYEKSNIRFGKKSNFYL